MPVGGVFSNFLNLGERFFSGSNAVARKVAPHHRPSSTEPAQAVHVDRAAFCNAFINEVQDLHHLVPGRDRRVTNGNPAEANLQSHGLGNFLDHIFIRDKEISIPIELAGLHEVDNLSNAMFEKSGQLSLCLTLLL